MYLFFAAIMIAAVFSTKIASRLGLPVLIAFIGIGLLSGSDVLNLFYFDDAALAKRVADILIAFIVFFGGFRTRKTSLKDVGGPSLMLATVGVALTAATLGLLAHLLLGMPLPFALMVASIISSTDAAAVQMITRANPVRERVAATLEVESAANDPMAILLTIAFVEALSGRAGSPAVSALLLVWQLAGGLLVGWLASLAARALFDRLDADGRGYYDVLLMGSVLAGYGLADLAGANGIIAVFAMGFALGNSDFVGKRGASNFLEGVTTFANIALFLMLGLLAFPGRFGGVWLEGLAIAAVLMFVARPLAVVACTLPFKYDWKERLFMAWGGLKGAVPIVLATYPAAFGLDPEGEIFSIIFFSVLLSCLAQGTTLGPLARLLRLVVPAKPRSPHTLELHSTRKCDLDMFEVRIEADSRAVGARVSELGLPEDALIGSMIRDGRVIAPRGSTALRENDILYLLARASLGERIAGVLNAKPEPLHPDKAKDMEIESLR